jgi:hypothetical protein
VMCVAANTWLVVGERNTCADGGANYSTYHHTQGHGVCGLGQKAQIARVTIEDI